MIRMYFQSVAIVNTCCDWLTQLGYKHQVVYVVKGGYKVVAHDS